MAATNAVSIVEMVLFVVLVLLVFFQQFLTVRDNQKLPRALPEREAQLRHPAFHDPLTGLANRALFIDRATHALQLHRRDRRPLAICFLDLDGFKAVNDHLGHNAGGDLLTEVAGRFRQRLSDADTLARFGGNEFAVLLENQPDPVKVARALLGSLRAPFRVAGWRDGRPGGRPVSPNIFVRVAESCNLIDSLFRFVLEQACTQLARWTELPGGSDLRVAVNITPGQLASPELPPVIATELARHGLTGEQLCLEITETGRLADTTTSRRVCDELRALGVRHSMDDFGAGQSTLTRLRDLPIDEVKIDRSFIVNLDLDEARRRFVWGVVAFAERIGFTVVAEGVEREAELEALTKLGCHRAQGFPFSRPIPASTVAELLGTPHNWLLEVATTPPEPKNGNVRQHPRDPKAQLLAVDTPSQPFELNTTGAHPSAPRPESPPIGYESESLSGSLSGIPERHSALRSFSSWLRIEPRRHPDHVRGAR